MRPDQFLFFFCGLGVFNGLLLTAYLLWPRIGKPTERYWLGGLVAMFVIRVGISGGYYFEGRIPWEIVQLGMVANVMVGPFLLVYLTERLPVTDGRRRTAKILLLTQLVILLIFGSFFSFTEFPRFWDTQLRYVLHAVLALYFVAATLLLWRHWRRGNSRDWYTSLTYLVCLFICLGFALSLYIDYSLGPLLATLFFYLGGGAWWYRRHYPLKQKPEITPLHPEEFRRLEIAMEKERLFAQPDLKLAAFSKATRLSPSRISKLLKAHTGAGFTRYLAEWRVREVKRLLRERPDLTMEAVGYEAGFHARSSFFATFKEATGLTPGAYQKKYAANQKEP